MFLNDPSSRFNTWTWSVWIFAVFSTTAWTIWPALLNTMFTRASSGEYEYVFCTKPCPRSFAEPATIVIF